MLQRTIYDLDPNGRPAALIVCCIAARRPEEVLTLTDAEVERAGNGTHEFRSRFSVAGAVLGNLARILADEPVTAWVTGMGVITYDIDRQGSDRHARTRSAPAL